MKGCVQWKPCSEGKCFASRRSRARDSYISRPALNLLSYRDRNFSAKIIVRYKTIGYNIDVLRQTACLVVNPIKVKNFAYLFDCTTVGRASD